MLINQMKKIRNFTPEEIRQILERAVENGVWGEITAYLENGKIVRVKDSETYMKGE